MGWCTVWWKAGSRGTKKRDMETRLQAAGWQLFKKKKKSNLCAAGEYPLWLIVKEQAAVLIS